MSQNQIKCVEQKENSEHAWKTLFERKNWKYDISYLTNWWLDFEIKLQKCLTKDRCKNKIKKIKQFLLGSDRCIQITIYVIGQTIKIAEKHGNRYHVTFTVTSQALEPC